MRKPEVAHDLQKLAARKCQVVRKSHADPDWLVAAQERTHRNPESRFGRAFWPSAAGLRFQTIRLK